MDENTPPTRRRSASLTAGGSSSNPSSSRSSHKHQPSRTEDILEAEEDGKQPGLDGTESVSGTASSEDFELDDMLSDEGLDDDEETGLTGAERHKRRRRKRKNAQLDQRIAGDVQITEEEDKLATKHVIKASLVNALLIGSWYLFSISISVYNKWMFSKSEDPENPDAEPSIVFPFPLFTTCIHMIVQFTLASLILFFFPRFRPRHDSVNPHGGSQSQVRAEPVDPTKPLMTTWFYLTRIGPCGLATGLDIGLGNMSLKFITLTFYTMCKSTVLGWVLMFAFLFRLEKPSWKLGAIIFTMTIGVIMMVAGETSFSVIGFVLIESAAASSGFRWSLTQILLLRNPATSNPFSSIFFLAPVMFFSLLVIALPVEGVTDVVAGFIRLTDAKGKLMGTLILLFPGCLAFCMVSAEFALLLRTSVVTLSVCGIFKEVVTISVANIVFDDSLTPINISGVLVTIACIAYYNYLKMTKMRDDARIEVHLANGDYTRVGEEDPDRGLNDGLAGRSGPSRLLGSSLNITSKLLPSDRGVDSPARVSPVKRPEDLD